MPPRNFTHKPIVKRDSYTVIELAYILNVDVKAARELVKTGAIGNCYKERNLWRIPGPDLEIYLEETYGARL